MYRIGGEKYPKTKETWTKLLSAKGKQFYTDFQCEKYTHKVLPSQNVVLNILACMEVMLSFRCVSVKHPAF